MFLMMDDIIIRKGKVEDVEDFVRLILLSNPVYYSSLYGSYRKRIMKNLFMQSGNFFSFEHSYFIEFKGKKAGMALAYNGKQKKGENLHTCLLLIKYLKWGLFTRIFSFLKTRDVGKIVEDEFYLNSIAVYPEFRSLGLGKKLLSIIEREAKKRGNKKIILNVEQNNERAVNFYEKLGYSLGEKIFNFKLNKKTFKFLRLYKIL